MSEPTNSDRRERAEVALRAYVEAKGEVFEGSSSEAADLIADLLHWAAHLDEETPSWHDSKKAQVLSLAEMHFDAEHGNPEHEW